MSFRRGIFDARQLDACRLRHFQQEIIFLKQVTDKSQMLIINNLSTKSNKKINVLKKYAIDAFIKCFIIFMKNFIGWEVL